MKKLDDVFSFDSGIFAKLQVLNVPWRMEGMQASLDLEYHGNRSGQKYISPLVDKMLINGELSDTNKGKLASVIFTMYGKNWEKLWNTLSFDYDPIENYRMVETETTQGTSSNTSVKTGSYTDAHSGSDTHDTDGTVKYTGDDTVKHTGTDTTQNTGTITNTGTVETSVYGFNSSNKVPAGASEPNTTTTNNLTDTNTKNLTDTDTKNLTDTTDMSLTDTYNSTMTHTDNNLTDTITGSDTGNRQLTRSGNIGVTTSQQMIESERILWDWIFFDRVFKDIDSVLTLSCY